MSGLVNLIKRDAATKSTYDMPMYTLLVVLIVLVIVTLISVFTLLFVRYRRRRAAQSQELPMHNEKRISRSNHRRVTVRPTESIYITQEKQNLLDNSDAPPSPHGVPEIRIHFPEELDTDGKTQSGRVVVVHVGEKGVGLEPCNDKLPSYTQSERFQSLDLERLGGLKEKAVEARWS
ncbi:hypothetical protein MBLNU457_3557t1 [Dothideomycetes sp. NU457]